MRFNPDINKDNKEAQEVIFSLKLQKSNHPSLTFNGTSITQSETEKHLGMFLDSKLSFLDFKEHIQNALSKISETIRLLHKLKKSFTKTSSNNNI